MFGIHVWRRFKEQFAESEIGKELEYTVEKIYVETVFQRFEALMDNLVSGRVRVRKLEGRLDLTKLTLHDNIRFQVFFISALVCTTLNILSTVLCLWARISKPPTFFFTICKLTFLLPKVIFREFTNVSLGSN